MSNYRNPAEINIDFDEPVINLAAEDQPEIIVLDSDDEPEIIDDDYFKILDNGLIEYQPNISSHPRFIHSSPSTESFNLSRKKLTLNSCGICLGIKRIFVELSCNHAMCCDCWPGFAERSAICPFCRVEYSERTVIVQLPNLLVNQI